MTLEKAIESLREEIKHPYSAKKMVRPVVLQLGLEALERIKYLQGIALYRTDTMLPSETKE